MQYDFVNFPQLLWKVVHIQLWFYVVYENLMNHFFIHIYYEMLVLIQFIYISKYNRNDFFVEF